MATILDVGVEYVDLWEYHSRWSQATFGDDNNRGPLGPLKHLEKEAKEAQEAWQAIGLADAHMSERAKKFRAQIADCMLLLFDAARRGGMKPLDLLLEAKAKLAINKTREWPAASPNEPVEHVRIRQDGIDHDPRC